jgi:hypothetical protein
VAVVKPHGSANWLQDFSHATIDAPIGGVCPIMAPLGAEPPFRTCLGLAESGGRIHGGQIVAVAPGQVPSRGGEFGFLCTPSLVSLYTRGKETPWNDWATQTARAHYDAMFERRTVLGLIGINPRAYDAHLWDPVVGTGDRVERCVYLDPNARRNAKDLLQPRLLNRLVMIEKEFQPGLGDCLAELTAPTRRRTATGT